MINDWFRFGAMVFRIEDSWARVLFKYLKL